MAINFGFYLCERVVFSALTVYLIISLFPFSWEVLKNSFQCNFSWCWKSSSFSAKEWQTIWFILVAKALFASDTLTVFLNTLLSCYNLFCQWRPESHPVLKIRMYCISIITFPVLFSVFLLVTFHNLFALLVTCEHQAFFRENRKLPQDVLSM